ncbi:MAG: hypothetical protein HYS04_18195 [Acidobacteria bacterium]|nr:hypothetical protein [Acidobacteriota bacterium]
MLASLWGNLPAILAFALLLFQAALPWTANSFVTQDGPSHLYTAVVARDLLFNSHSPYAPVYTLQLKPGSNWGTVVIFNLLVLLFGAAHAEQALATVSIVTGFLAFAYFSRSLDPNGTPWSPVVNFLLTTWFLWIGFYNFYIGIVLCVFIAGFYIRHARALTWKQAALIASGLLMLFLLHALAVALAVMAILVIAAWVHGVAPLINGCNVSGRIHALRAAVVPIAAVAAAVAPALAALGLFVMFPLKTDLSPPEAGWAWANFPLHVFASGRGRAGEQTLLWTGMLFYMVLGALSMRREEWASPRGGVVLAAAATFCLYLFSPNAGFGGGEIKIRLAWAVFIFGCLAASSVTRMGPLRTAVSIYIAFFLTGTLIHCMRDNVQKASRAVAEYASALAAVPQGATFVRLRYSMEATQLRFGIHEIPLDPLFHADAWVAARRHFIALSDYQAGARIFPVVFAARVPHEQQRQLADLEGTAIDGLESLESLLKDFPVPIEYVAVLGDGSTPQPGFDLDRTLSVLRARMQLVSADPSNSFVRVYKRTSTPRAGSPGP